LIGDSATAENASVTKDPIISSKRHSTIRDDRSLLMRGTYG
jgi:hypothetical protein